MKKIFYHSILMLAAILASNILLGCTVDEGTSVSEIPIVVTVGPRDTVFVEIPLTRGTMVNTAGISSFGVSASVYPAASSYTSAGCGSYFYNESVTPGTSFGYYWPTASYKLSFFAYYPYGNSNLTLQSGAATLGTPTYAYTVPSVVSQQVDMMTGQYVNHLGGGSSPVNLTMKHRCAAICFNVTNERSSAITLNTIGIEGVKYTGTLNEETWTLESAVNSSSSNPFTLTYGSSIAADATANITGTTNIFLMLPQTIPAGAKLKVSVNDEDPMYADLSGTWEAGKQYGYSVRVTPLGIIVDPLTDVSDWAAETKYLTVDGVTSGNTWTQPSVTDADDVGAEDWTEEDE